MWEGLLELHLLGEGVWVHEFLKAQEVVLWLELCTYMSVLR